MKTLTRIAALLCAVLALAAPGAWAADLTLTYPTTRADGTALATTAIAECRIVDVTGTTEVLLATLKPPATNHTIANTTLINGRYFQAYCIDTGGLESARSARLLAKVNPASAPGLSITFRAGAI